MSNNLLADFDFKVLDDKEFKEDAVREEIIAPLIKMLGFEASGVRKVVRGRKLAHPVVHIGTTAIKIKIIPDYILLYNDIPILVIDAKAPKQNIETGKNVEQVFSYSIHPEIRTYYYALCNGKTFSIFSRSELVPTKFSLEDFPNNFQELRYLIDKIETETCRAQKNIDDFGMLLYKSGRFNINFHKIYTHIASISKVSDIHYLIVALDRYGSNFEDLMHLSFLLKKKHLKYFLELVSPDLKEKVKDAISLSPFYYHFEADDLILNVYSTQQQRVLYDFTWNIYKFLPFEIIFFEKWVPDDDKLNPTELSNKIQKIIDNHPIWK